jgi:hypothetical protein
LLDMRDIRGAEEADVHGGCCWIRRCAVVGWGGVVKLRL